MVSRPGAQEEEKGVCVCVCVCALVHVCVYTALHVMNCKYLLHCHQCHVYSMVHILVCTRAVIVAPTVSLSSVPPPQPELGPTGKPQWATDMAIAHQHSKIIIATGYVGGLAQCMPKWTLGNLTSYAGPNPSPHHPPNLTHLSHSLCHLVLSISLAFLPPNLPLISLSLPFSSLFVVVKTVFSSLSCPILSPTANSLTWRT